MLEDVRAMEERRDERSAGHTDNRAIVRSNEAGTIDKLGVRGVPDAMSCHMSLYLKIIVLAPAISVIYR